MPLAFVLIGYGVHTRANEAPLTACPVFYRPRQSKPRRNAAENNCLRRKRAAMRRRGRKRLRPRIPLECGMQRQRG